MKWGGVFIFVKLVAKIEVCSTFARPLHRLESRWQCRRNSLPTFLLAERGRREVAASIRRSKLVADVLVLMDESGAKSNAAALRRLALLSTSRYTCHEDRILAEEQIEILLEQVEHVLDSDSVDMNLRDLVDILTALAALKNDKRRVVPMAIRVLRLVDESEQEVDKIVRPHRLVEILEALSALDIDHSSLIRRICHRLQQGDALASLEPRHLARGLKAMVTMHGIAHDNHAKAMKAFMRRWRKQSVRQSASTAEICQTLYAARRLMQDTKSHDVCIEETTTMVYTLMRELHIPSRKAPGPRSLSAGQVAEVLMTAAAFHVNTTNPVVDFLFDNLQREPTMERATVPDISRILWSMERLRLSRYSLVVESLGIQLHKLVHQRRAIEPRSVCNCLTSACRLCHRDVEIPEPFIELSRDLILESRNGTESSFLQRCSDVELSSLARFLYSVRCDDEQVIVALCERTLEPDIVESCSPKAACQILTHVTSWTDVSPTEMKVMQPILSDLFHELGTHLLSAQLTPSETSASMQAYAKASYVQDMGIFDYLAGHLSSQLSDCSIRHVVKALWSCGKMQMWEADVYDEQDDVGPPYLEAARKYAVFLASNASQLNSKDVSQALWAIGRLGIDEASVVNAFASRASQVMSECNTLEVANILWGLSRVGYSDCEVTLVLTDRMMELEPSPQEAATVLYALGRMEIRDEDVFGSMSKVMMGQLENASAQAVANALWAYRTVEIPPPRELMDSWVTQKLGLDGAPNRIEDS